MDKEYIEELAKEPRFICGIYNYCDRWCERCAFTSRCMNYEISEKEFSDPETQDIRNKAFWDKLGEILSGTFEMVVEKAKELGVDLDEICSDETADDFERIQEQAMEQPYSTAAMKYIEMVDNWFETNNERLEAKGLELVSHVQANIPGTNPENDALKINDCLEVIRWYKYQMYVKLCRAAGGIINNRPEEIEFNKSDADGSAKVALIGIERSISAWAGLIEHFPEQDNEILDLLITLKRLMPQVEAAFPDARAFKRPGFDTLDNT